jgi:hypothetical protein
MPPAPPLRRADDERFAEFKSELSDIKETIGEIRDMLISEPEASPLGRNLLQRSRDNAGDITDLELRVKSLEGWRSEWRGSWRLVTGVATVAGLVGAFFGIASWFGWHT